MNKTDYEARAREILGTKAADADVASVMVGLQVEDELRAREVEEQITPWDLFAAAALAGRLAAGGNIDIGVLAELADDMMSERNARRGNDA